MEAFFQIFRIHFLNYFIKNPQTTIALIFKTHIISGLDGVIRAVGRSENLGMARSEKGLIIGKFSLYFKPKFGWEIAPGPTALVIFNHYNFHVKKQFSVLKTWKFSCIFFSSIGFLQSKQKVCRENFQKVKKYNLCSVWA